MKPITKLDVAKELLTLASSIEDESHLILVLEMIVKVLKGELK